LKLKQYQKMKDSGFEWIGKIPEHWTVRKIGNVAHVTKLAGFEYTEYFDYQDEGEIPVVRAQNVQMGKFVPVHLKYISKEISNALPRSQLFGKEVLMVYIGEVGTVCLSPSNQRLHLGPNVAKITPHENHRDFLCYFLQSYAGITNASLASKTTVQPNFSMYSIRKFYITVPPKQEQKLIAGFLDKETKKIDFDISKNQKLVELFKEKQQAVIDKIVTKGLDPTIAMKDSGIEMLGKIPDHWLTTSLGKIVELITYGITVRPEYFDEGIPLISARELRGGEINFDDAPRISEKDFALISEKAKGKFDDLFYSKTGTIGLVARCKKKILYVISQNIARIVPDKKLILTEYLEYLLRTNYFFHSAFSTTNTATVRDLQLGDMKKIRLSLPPKTEQIQISQFVSENLTKINELISKVENKTKKLQEYRQSLISDVVTGKIDVRNGI